MMRKLTAGLFHSVDGVVEAPDQFQFDSFDDELGMLLGGLMPRIDTVLLGRIGYSEWASYWPDAKQDLDFAGFINNVPKFVASHTLTAPLAWQNATLIEGDLVPFVEGLKQQPGGEIAVMGSISLVRQLFLAGLMDELTLITHPVVAGKGRHLFEPGDDVTRLDLVDGYKTSKGNLVSIYRLKK